MTNKNNMGNNKEKLGEHEMRCNSCGQIMDLRDISQVFAHEDCGGSPVDYAAIEQIQYSWSQKIGEPTLHTKKRGDIGLN